MLLEMVRANFATSISRFQITLTSSRTSKSKDLGIDLEVYRSILALRVNLEVDEISSP